MIRLIFETCPKEQVTHSHSAESFYKRKPKKQKQRKQITDNSQNHLSQIPSWFCLFITPDYTQSYHHINLNFFFCFCFLCGWEMEKGRRMGQRIVSPFPVTVRFIPKILLWLASHLVMAYRHTRDRPVDKRDKNPRYLLSILFTKFK